MACIYTREELIDKIKAIDAKLEKAVDKSELDTTQNRQTFEIDVPELRKQREYYMQCVNNIDQQNNKSGLATLVRSPRRFYPWGR